MIVKIREMVPFTRATPGSSLLYNRPGEIFRGKVPIPTSKFGSKGKYTPILSALEAFLTTSRELQSWPFIGGSGVRSKVWD